MRIRDWSVHFECAQSRKLKVLNWVPLRVNLSGDGYSELISHPDGAAHFGTWIALVELAATQKQRGALMRSNGRPHDPESLSRIIRIPVRIVSEAVSRLIHIGWIEEEVGGIVQHTGLIEGEVGRIVQHAGSPPRNFGATVQDITVQDSTESNTSSNAVAFEGQTDSPREISINETPFESLEPSGMLPGCESPDAVVIDPANERKALAAQQGKWFEQFWAAYWLKKGRKGAQKAFGRCVRTAERFQEVMEAIRVQSVEMLSREPQHRPHCQTWLNGARWEDEPAAVAVKAETQTERIVRKIREEREKSQ